MTKGITFQSAFCRGSIPPYGACYGICMMMLEMGELCSQRKTALAL